MTTLLSQRFSATKQKNKNKQTIQIPINQQPKEVCFETNLGFQIKDFGEENEQQKLKKEKKKKKKKMDFTHSGLAGLAFT